LPYGYESNEVENVESEIKFIVREYGLKKDHFDFELYNESDLFIDNYFDSS